MAKILFLIICNLFINQSRALSNYENVQIYPIDSVFSVRQDISINTLTLYFKVIYPNGCYSLSVNSISQNINNFNIYIKLNVNQSFGLCTMALIHRIYALTINLPLDGKYSLIDQSTQKQIGTLMITDRTAFLDSQNQE